MDLIHFSRVCGWASPKGCVYFYEHVIDMKMLFCTNHEFKSVFKIYSDVLIDLKTNLTFTCTVISILWSSLLSDGMTLPYIFRNDITTCKHPILNKRNTIFSMEVRIDVRKSSMQSCGIVITFCINREIVIVKLIGKSL